jgi:hypothetical protein
VKIVDLNVLLYVVNENAVRHEALAFQTRLCRNRGG